jgi:transposase
VAHRVGLAKQLGAHLRTVFPGAVGLFAGIDSAISLAFPDPIHHPGQGRLARPDPAGQLAGLGRLLRQGRPTVLHARLLAAPRGALGADAVANAAITQSFVAVLGSLLEQIKTLTRQFETQLAAHVQSNEDRILSPPQHPISWVLGSPREPKDPLLTHGQDLRMNAGYD